MKAFIICSGGLDSVSLAYHLDHKNALAGVISFDYGQRHKKELQFAHSCAKRLNVPYFPIDISSIGANLSGSALTDNIDVPDGHYAEETMKITVVPNRNAIFLAIAFGIANAKGATHVAMAVHSGDHFIYPDCRADFIHAYDEMERLALEDQCRIYTPYVHLKKSEIVSDGANYNVPFSETWSCYKGGKNHCGRCGTCVERREAFHCAGIADPTQYDDDSFWLEAIKSNLGYNKS